MAEESLYERLGGIYGIAGAGDVLVDRLYRNASANANPAVEAFHAQQGSPASRSWSPRGRWRRPADPRATPGGT